MKIVDKRAMSQIDGERVMSSHQLLMEFLLAEGMDKQLGEAGAHENDLLRAALDMKKQLMKLIQMTFDTCIHVCQDHADEEALKNRYKGEEVRQRQRMAEEIVQELTRLRASPL